MLETLKLCKDQKELISTLIEISADKKKQFEEIEKIGESEERILQDKMDEMFHFSRSIIPAHYKAFSKKQDLLKECIYNREPIIHGMFDVFFQTKELVEWMDSFNVYIENFDKIHMKTILKRLCEKNSINYEKMESCRTDLVKGAYEFYQ